MCTFTLQTRQYLESRVLELLRNILMSEGSENTRINPEIIKIIHMMDTNAERGMRVESKEKNGS